MNRFEKKLNDLGNQNRRRSLNPPNGVDLTSNDYLGLRKHPALRSAAIEALENGIDIGAGGSRLLRGHAQAHADLEDFAAQYFNAEKALYFATGFQANQAIFSTLPGRHDLIIFDEFIHASAREAIQNSPVKHAKIRHNDLNAFEDALKNADRKFEMLWLAVESVYSMDGDLAPLKDLYALAQKYGATLIIDEAHGTGVFGPTGKGLSEIIHDPNIITLHTCGKALGVAGGLITGAREVIDYLVNHARGFIYSTAPIPLQAMLVHKALELARDEPWRRQKLFEIIDLTGRLLPVDKAVSQIVPIILGDDARAIKVAKDLQSAGFDVRAIRPPSVPEGTARLRIALSCDLDESKLKNFAAALMPHLQRRAA